MAMQLEHFGGEIDEQYLQYLVDQQACENQAVYGRLWDYFRNPLTPAIGDVCETAHPYVQAQEAGLPARITGARRRGHNEAMTDLSRKEVVIENDIAWRVQTMVDYLFGRMPVIRSTAPDKRLACAIDQVVAVMLEANGGCGFLQEMALLGSVYGFVDIALRGGGQAFADQTGAPFPVEAAAASAQAADGSQPPAMPSAAVAPRPVMSDYSDVTIARAVAAARLLQLEAIEAPRVLPVLDEYDYRRLRLWVQRFTCRPARLEGGRRGFLGLFGRRGGSPASVEVIEVISPSWWQRYEDRRLVAQGANALGRLGVVHVQNMAMAGSYAGLSDVEPLIPLQDELNTRLSDRAHRVTYQSFRMYLGKGVDDFLERPVGPGQMWSTTNADATIEEFGSDSGSPSEDAHIEQIRAALDKMSAVTPLAAGLIGGNVGRLTSGTALRVVLSGLLSRTARKRLTYGAGLAQIVELALEWLDRVGVLSTAPADRKVEIHWPDVVPVDEGQQLRNAQIKAQLGVPAGRLLAELGYGSDQTAPPAAMTNDQ